MPSTTLIAPVAAAGQDSIGEEEQSTYGQILKSSALVGGSSIINIVIGMARAKAMALLLGPSGVGLFGVYGAISDLAQNIAGMGVNSSGVRQIAEAVGSGDLERIGRTAAVLRRVSLFLGVLGAALLIALSGVISTLTFGDSQRALAISLLSIAVLFRLISGGQGALIQGLRRIGDLARMNVLGAFFGAVFTIPLVYFLREDGVAPSLICVAATMVVTSWWHSRRVRIPTPAMSTTEMATEAGALLKLGLVFMSSALMTMGTAYVVRIAVLHNAGMGGAGIYQSAWTLGGLYVGLVLQAMGADFYPRLTANAHNNPACNRIVNEQALIGLLLAGPGVIATLTFAPLVIAVFYSSKFEPAVDLLRWLCLGVTMQVISWPMGFIIVAKGKQAIFFWTEAAWTSVHIGLAWICLRRFGLTGAGMAFFGSYVFQALMLYPIVARLSGFRWSAKNWRTGLFFLSWTALVFAGFYVLPRQWAILLGIVSAAVTGLYSLRMLVSLAPIAKLPLPLQRVLVCLVASRRSGGPLESSVGTQ